VIAWGVVLERGLWAGVAALGFAVLFNVPRRALGACAGLGASAFMSRALIVELGLCSTELATFFAAVLAGVGALSLGKSLRAPAVVFAVPAVIPFVPGALALRSTASLLSLTTGGDALDAQAFVAVARDVLRVAIITLAMAGGVAVPSLILRRKSPMT
jgi:uncharacterized membrane protein YjjB (DUF3815 family)